MKIIKFDRNNFNIKIPIIQNYIYLQKIIHNHIVNAYEEQKSAQAAATLSSAKNSKVVAAVNEAYILPKTLKIESDKANFYLKIIKFDYKISVRSTVMITFAWRPHKPDDFNPFEYESWISSKISSVSYNCDPTLNGVQNTISFPFNPVDYSSFEMNAITESFFPCLIHIYAQYASSDHKQSENLIYCSFGPTMDSIKIEKNIMKIFKFYNLINNAEKGWKVIRNENSLWNCKRWRGKQWQSLLSLHRKSKKYDS